MSIRKTWESIRRIEDPHLGLYLRVSSRVITTL